MFTVNMKNGKQNGKYNRMRNKSDKSDKNMGC